MLIESLEIEYFILNYISPIWTNKGVTTLISLSRSEKLNASEDATRHRLYVRFLMIGSSGFLVNGCSDSLTL